MVYPSCRRIAGAPARTALAAPGDPAPRIARAQAFSIDRALDAYEKLFDEVIAESS